MKKIFDGVKNLFGKKTEVKADVEDEVNDEFLIENSILISGNRSDRVAFNEVVRMFCDELRNQLGLKIDPKKFIRISPFKDVPRIEFEVNIPQNISDEEILIFNITKKNVQLKIKGVRKYEDINLIGTKKIFFINSSHILNLWNIIKADEKLRNHTPLYLMFEARYYSCILDYDRFVDFAKKLDIHLGISRPVEAYEDVRRRIIDAVTLVTNGRSTKLKKNADKETIKEVVSHLAQQRAFKLVYTRNYIWDLEDLKKKPSSFLKNLSTLSDFTIKTLKSHPYIDFLIPSFEISSYDYIQPTHGCYAMLNDKKQLDKELFLAKLPDTLKEV